MDKARRLIAKRARIIRSLAVARTTEPSATTTGSDISRPTAGSIAHPLQRLSGDCPRQRGLLLGVGIQRWQAFKGNQVGHWRRRNRRRFGHFWQLKQIIEVSLQD